MLKAVLAGFVTCASLVACDSGGDEPSVPAGSRIEVSSSAFAGDGKIPAEHTCDGAGKPVPLSWEAAAGADGYALAMTDPDAPGGRFTHWVVFGLPGTVTEIGPRLPGSAVQGLNGFGDPAYGGPCPPKGDPPHRYEFVVYALGDGADTGHLSTASTLEELLDAIRCCVVASGRLTGIYERG